MFRLRLTGLLVVTSAVLASLPTSAEKPAYREALPRTARENPTPATLPGVPLGGIGCGTITVLPNGRFAHATINNNWERPIERLPGCFAAVWARGGDVASAHVFSTAPEYGLPGSPGVKFDGYFPRAILREADTKFPVSVTLRAYSSLVPQDLKNSSVPAAVFVFILKNESHAPVDAAVAVSWENLLGVGGTAGKGAFSDRTGNRVEMLPASGGIFGMRMSSPATQTVDPPHRLIYNARGTYALLAAPSTPETEVTMAGWNALDASPGWWKSFSRDGTVGGVTGSGVEAKVHPSGVIALKVSLKEDETRELPFVVAWHTPRLYALDGAEYGHYYEKSFEDAVEVGRYALDNRQTNLALLDEWQNRLLRCSLPGWFTRQVMNDASVLFTRTILTDDSGHGGTDPGPFRFAFLDEAPDEKMSLGSVHNRYLAHQAVMTWFPQLDILELGDYASRQRPSGALVDSLGSLEQGFIPDESVQESPSGSVAETVASYTIQVLSRFRWTGDQRFLDRFYPSVKHAVENLAAQATEPRDETSLQTDPSHHRSRWMRHAAFKMAEKLAGIMSDKRFEGQCKNWASRSEVTITENDPPLDIVRSASSAAWMLLETDLTDDLPGRFTSWVQALASGGPTETSEGPQLSLLPDAALAFSAGSARAAAPLVGAILAGGSHNPDLSLAWLLGLRTLSPAASSTSRQGDSASPASWSMLNALIGFAADLPSGSLRLAPSLPAKAKSLVAPLFAPTFWASLDYRLSLTSARLTFRLERIMPANPVRKEQKTGANPGEVTAADLVLRQVILPERPGRTTTEVTASAGRSPVPGHFGRRQDGQLLFTFASPLSLAVGQSLSFLMR